MSAPAVTGMKKSGERELTLDWSDGRSTTFDVVDLRRKCPCATCVDEWSGELRLDPATIGEDIRPQKIDPVGHYAISIQFSDGHRTGIYSFEYLRRLADGGPGKGVEPTDSRQATRGYDDA